MPGRSRWRRTADATAIASLVLLASGMIAAPAPAQLLDLRPGGGGAPQVAGEGTDALIDFLTAEADRLKDEHAKADTKAAGELDGFAEAAFNVRISAHLRAADLLTTARDLGDAGAAHAIAAFTLIARFDAVDAWANAFGKAPFPSPAGTGAETFTIGEDDIGTARDPAGLDRWLARVFGPRAEWIGPAPYARWNHLRLHAGWTPAGETCHDPTLLAEVIDRWNTPGRGGQPAARERRLSDEAAATLRRFDAAMAYPTASWWAHAARYQRIEELIRTAGGVMDGLEPAPPRETADALAARFDEACRAIGSEDVRWIATLEDLADAVTLVDDTARAMSAAPRGLSSSNRDLIWKKFWAAQLGSTSDDRARRDAHRRAVETLLATSNLPRDDAFVREARPMFRRLNIELDMAERELWTSLPRPTSRNPLDDPGIVGSLATVKRLTAAIRGLAVISTLLEPSKKPAGKPDPSLVKVRDRLLALAKDLEKPVVRDTAMNALLPFLDAGDAFAPSAAERVLRAAPLDAVWSGASDGKCVELLTALDSTRAAALRSWGESGPDTNELIARARSLTRLVDLVYCGSVSARMAHEASAARAGVISRHPAVELSRAAAAALLIDLEPNVARLVSLALTEALRAPALKEADKLYAASAAARLFARLETDARAMELADVDPAIELSAGRGPRPWLDGQRANLALICWHAHELAAAQLRNDREQIARRTSQINELATQTLDSLNR